MRSGTLETSLPGTKDSGTCLTGSVQLGHLIRRKRASSGTLYHRKWPARVSYTTRDGQLRVPKHRECSPRAWPDYVGQRFSPLCRTAGHSIRQPHNRAFHRESSISGTLNLKKKTSKPASGARRRPLVFWKFSNHASVTALALIYHDSSS